jgi:hypothetical protein
MMADSYLKLFGWKRENEGSGKGSEDFPWAHLSIFPIWRDNGKIMKKSCSFTLIINFVFHKIKGKKGFYKLSLQINSPPNSFHQNNKRGNYFSPVTFFPFIFNYFTFLPFILGSQTQNKS